MYHQVQKKETISGMDKDLNYVLMHFLVAFIIFCVQHKTKINYAIYTLLQQKKSLFEKNENINGLALMLWAK